MIIDVRNVCGLSDAKREPASFGSLYGVALQTRRDDAITL